MKKISVEMLKLTMIFCVWRLTLFGIVESRSSQSTKLSILDKFQQSDYKLDFERVEMVRHNHQFLKHFHVVTRKYNRTCPVVDSTIGYKIDVGEGLEVIVQAYKFASNEYRPFPIRLEFDMCEAIAKNSVGLGEYQTCGNFTGCPFLKEKVYKICNWKPNTANFPPLIPNGQYMLELQAIYFSVEMWVVRGFGTVSRPVMVP